jgi:hypothetical protein
MLAPAKVVLYYNNISLTSKIPAIYNTELYWDTLQGTGFLNFHPAETLFLYVLSCYVSRYVKWIYLKVWVPHLIINSILSAESFYRNKLPFESVAQLINKELWTKLIKPTSWFRTFLVLQIY